jgi:hypothetical protein
MKTRETNEEFAERIRHLPRSERKALIAERMTPQEETELLRDSTVAFVLGALFLLSIIIF